MNMKRLLSVILISALLLMPAACSAEKTKTSTPLHEDPPAESASESESESKTPPETRDIESTVLTEQSTSAASAATTEETTEVTESTTEASSETTVPETTEASKATEPESTTSESKETSASDTTSSADDPPLDTSSSDDTSSTDGSSDDTSTSITPIEMPDVMGMYYQDAMDLLDATLKDAGYSEVIVALGWAWGDGNPDKTLTIIGQEPSAGTLLDTSSSSITVIIYAQEHGHE